MADCVLAGVHHIRSDGENPRIAIKENGHIPVRLTTLQNSAENGVTKTFFNMNQR